MYYYFVFAVLLCVSGAAFSCDTTVNNESAITAALNSSAYTEVCVSPGVYSFSSPLEVSDGKRLTGSGSLKTDVVIEGSGSRVIRLQDNARVRNLHVRGASGTLPTFGILSYYNTGQIIWSVKVTNTKISIGINGSNNVSVWDSFLSLNGDLANGMADPNLWISNSTGVDVKYGSLRGRSNGPGGDGELSCIDSSNVSVLQTPIFDSGASAIYFVNCDNATIDGLDIRRPDEWGIDVVHGSDYVTIQNNSVESARFGGSVYHEYNSVGGVFRDNTFLDNVTGTWQEPCNGINVRGQPSQVTRSGNYASPAPVICQISQN